MVYRLDLSLYACYRLQVFATFPVSSGLFSRNLLRLKFDVNNINIFVDLLRHLLTSSLFSLVKFLERETGHVYSSHLSSDFYLLHCRSDYCVFTVQVISFPLKKVTFFCCVGKLNGDFVAEASSLLSLIFRGRPQQKLNLLLSLSYEFIGIHNPSVSHTSLMAFFPSRLFLVAFLVTLFAIASSMNERGFGMPGNLKLYDS